ncbi:uncharacterized protein LOC107488845 [Arachis duranensis]|uniref:Uncharacterized protein LOC107488845 n=1 Tax=Arachis duranensis TaxID=130453 RepID=A0A6P4DF56_ARADU|nr:uncharacterized protein LOC107488845 [Arachis duranensis]
MRLNPEKCAFGVTGGKFLGFILTSRGIEANPEKCQAILDMQSPTTIKDVQRLTGSSVLITEAEKVQHPVYFVSKSLQSAELRYPKLEKLSLALILSKPKLAGRLIKWSIELSEFDIQYQPRGSVKSQYLVDFVAELTEPYLDAESLEWTLFVDGASNLQGSGVGILLESPEGIIMEHSLRFSFKASNNQVEYEALIDGLRRGYSRPLLKCLDRSEVDLVLAEAHEGICGIHSGARSLAQKIPRAGFYWPTLWEDSRQKWGIDILGPFPTASRQFTDHNFKNFLQNLKINQHFSSVEHPQSNRLAEVANKVLLHALRKKLDNANGLWAELVPEVLCSYNTTIHTSTKETPFRLVYGSEAMIPLEISQHSLRAQVEHHDQARRAELDLIEEVRNIAAIRHQALQQQIGRRHDKRVQPRSFNTGNLVLRKTEETR